MGVLGDKLNEALNNINNYVWKGPKQEVNGVRVQSEIKLIDASLSQLQQFYDHCVSMLDSTDKKNPGRRVLKKIVQDQRDRCNTQLYVRWLENKYKTDYPEPRKEFPKFLYLQDVLNILSNNEDIIPKNTYDTTPISRVTNGVPMEFRDVTIAKVQEGCLGTLGIFDRSHISLNFITKLGVWFTDKEMNDLTVKDENGKVKDRIEVIKERHNLRPNVNLRPNFKGLTYTELRAMLNLKTKKYSDLSTDQLLVLRDKVLFRFEEEIDFHISQWEERIRQLEEVAQAKFGVSLIS